MHALRRTPLFDRHAALGATLVDFGGWEMPLQYPTGIVEEHLATRRAAGLFDVSHMGRFLFRGAGSLAFLQHALTNNAAALETGQAQYTFLANESGGAVDDAYLYRFRPEDYLLVVNAANRDKDWRHLDALRSSFPETGMSDVSAEIAMIALQGPQAKEILAGLLERGGLPEPLKNALGIAFLAGAEIGIARTGYTGEPIGFELFTPAEAAGRLWDLCLQKGASPVGLGARDTLRLEAGFPLYGHELGLDPEGGEIPLFATPLARFSVSFSPVKGDFVGRRALEGQFAALKDILRGKEAAPARLPRRILPVALLGKGVARAGFRVFRGEEPAGWITSGTVVPYWKVAGEGLASRRTGERGMRAIGLAYVDSRLREEDRASVEIRGQRVEAVVVPCHLRTDAPPHARPVLYGPAPQPPPPETGDYAARARRLVARAADNTRWRQEQCINLIPSEQTPSPAVRLLSVMDPAFRYAEHRTMRAFHDLDVFFYQGTDFIAEVERLLEKELCAYLSCAEVETRVISGQMANAAVFGALVDWINRLDRKAEPRRLRRVVNNHILRGGHLSAQPTGALFNFVQTDPQTDRPAVVNFPVIPDNPYKIDVEAAKALLARHRPELVIFGKSMVLYREPVAEVRAFLQAEQIDAVILYDMAHVLGLVGPHFQEPFREGADLVTGSTHKTFFGTQRGIVAGNYRARDLRYPLWESLRARTFPGSVSNHHLGTLLGLLLAAYEMNAFKDAYQRQVLANARAFARALADEGLAVAGDPAAGFTETHQVILEVGFARGPELARRLEENNLIVNYQATPAEEGFTASGALRLGVAEMTRFGMNEEDFQALAPFFHTVIAAGENVKDEVAAFRRRFRELRYCFRGPDFTEAMETLHKLI